MQVRVAHVQRARELRVVADRTARVVRLGRHGLAVGDVLRREVDVVVARAAGRAHGRPAREARQQGQEGRRAGASGAHAAQQAAAPALGVLIAFQVLRRAGNFAIQRPAREVLYTVLSRTDKYKAKNFNDTFVYRVGDQLGAWSYTAIAWVGLGLSGLALTMVPVSALWLLLALWLGRQYLRAVETRRLDAVDARVTMSSP